MEIIKFNKFIINEAVQLPVIDIVIDNSGEVYNGEFNNLVKGYTELQKVNGRNTIVGILGSDKNKYIAGIDKNGTLVTCDKNISPDGYLVDDTGNYIIMNPKIGQLLKIKGGKWPIQFDYSKILSTESTGWVNFKVDMEIVKRVKRYSKGLGGPKTGHKSFLSKLEDLDSINFIKSRKRTIRSIQREMSVIMLLHYIEEIKDFFTPSSAGFLFESFIGGLLPNAKIISDNREADIISEGKEYQIKTLDAHNKPTVDFIMKSTETGMNFLDHYVVCFKYPGRIEIYVLDGDSSSDRYCGPICNDSDKLNVKKSSYTKIINSGIKPYVLDLLDIDNNINKISMGLKEVLGTLYSELSTFQYNVETIVSGVNKEGKLIDVDQFDVYSDMAKRNAETMKKELENLIAHYKGNI